MEAEQCRKASVTPDTDNELIRLRAQVEELQRPAQQRECSAGAGPSLDVQNPNPKRPCRWEEFVPFCDEEFQEWMEGRRKDLQSAVAAGQLGEVGRISQLLAQAIQEWQQKIQDQPVSGFPSAVANSVR